MELSAQCTASFSYSVSGGSVSFTSSSSPSGANHYWSFGNGSSSSTKNPTHTYSSNGTYTVCLTIFDSLRQCIDTTCSTVSISGLSTQCRAYFTSRTNGLSASFSNQSTKGLTYRWAFGDGNTSTSTSPSHTYSRSGGYLVCLFAIDSGTVCDTFCDSVYVSGSSGSNCRAAFTSKTNGLTASFSNQSSTGLSYRWVFGDGNSSTSTNPTHTYSRGGTYTVCLFAIDSGRVCDSICDSVYVQGSSGGNCRAYFTSRANGLTASFSNLSSSGLTYRWSFGDGNTSTSTNPNHTYSSSGTYWVCLFALDSGMVCDTFCDSIYVRSSSGGNCRAYFTSRTKNLTASFSNLSSGNGLTYRWVFGDGNSSTMTNPSHTYSRGGSYTVCLYALDSGMVCDSICDSIYVQGSSGGKCQAYFTSTSSGLTGYFNNRTVGNGLSYRWSFGDGNSSSMTNPSHTYSRSGTYWVCLFALDSGIVCDTFCDTINVKTQGGGCQAYFTSTSSGLTGYFTNRTVGSGLSYRWSFGDGNSSSMTNPSHTYSRSGTYWVCLYALDSGIVCDSVCDTINVKSQGGGGCNAFFTSTSRGLTGFFNNRSTGNGLSYRWSFGDGNSSSMASPSHTYSTGGTYWVCLYALDSGIVCDTFCDSITVQSQGGGGCKAYFTSTSNGLTSFFFNRSTGNGLTYRWSFGDGKSSTLPNPLHTYSTAGTYWVCLYALDSGVVCDTFCDSVIVKAAGGKCAAAFTSFQRGNATYFVNQSTGSNLGYRWNFGDGNTSSQKDPVHTYASAGSYQVCLYLLDSGRVCDSICDSIRVSGPVSVSKANKATLKVFPNPFHNEFVVKAGNGKLGSFRILDMTGKEKMVSAISTSSSTMTINTSNLPAGVYILQVSVGDQMESRRLIKH